MSSPRFATALLAAFLSVLCLDDRTPQHPNVTGTVTDINDARISGATLEFVRDRSKYTAATLEDGTYAVHLKPGRYDVSVSKFGFCKGRRSAFLLNEGSRLRFDFRLLVCGIYEPEGEPATGAQQRLPDRYQEEELPSLVPNGIRPLVLFGERKAAADSVQYSGFEFEGRQHPVVYTYDLLTVTADSLSYRQKDGRIKAAEDVLLEDGNTKRRGSRLDISFVSGKPEIALAP